MTTTVVNTAQPTPTPASTEITSPTPTDSAASTAAKPSDEMSAKFAALAKKERIARMQTQRVKQLEAQLAERERKIAERERQWDEEFRSTPLEAIKKRGITYEDMAKAALNDGKFDPATEVKSVKSEFQKFKDEQAEKEKRALEAQQQAQEQAEAQTISAFKERIGEYIKGNSEKLDFTTTFLDTEEAVETVFTTIEEHYKRTKAEGKPKILSVEEACDLYEAFLEEKFDEGSKKSKKFQTKFAAQKAKEEEKGKPAAKTSTTLTNTVATSAAPTLLNPKTEQDRIQRALAALG